MCQTIKYLQDYTIDLKETLREKDENISNWR